MRLDKLTLKSQEALELAQNTAMEQGNPQVDTEHLLYALLTDDQGLCLEILKNLNTDTKAILNEVRAALDRLPKQSGAGGAEGYFSNRLKSVLQQSFHEMEQFRDEFVSVEHLLMALSEGGGAAEKILKRHGITKDKILSTLESIRGTQRVTDQAPEEKYQALKRFTRDLTELASKDKLDPVIGRDDEIRRIIQVLSRRTKNNPVLIGDPGVGKTAIVEGTCRKDYFR